jgi:xylan 1,4-beta-xylosidase
MKRDIEVQVNAGKSQGGLDHYWRYIGFDECNFAYTPEGLELLRKFGRLEHEAYYIRSHFMFNTGNCHGVPKYGSTNIYTEDPDGNPVYNFEIYDKIIDSYLETGNKPFLELGFMPMDLIDTAYLPKMEPKQAARQYMHDGWSCPPKNYDKWHTLIETLGRHLIEKYGKDRVKTWYFELWNEPDISYWRGSIAEYCKLFDYTEHALHTADSDLRLGGPGVTTLIRGRLASEFFNYFLQHCKNGVNFYSGAAGTRLDFVSYHAKGGGFRFALRAEKEAPSVSNLTRHIRFGLDDMIKNGFSDREVVLSEADPDGWAAGGYYDNANLLFRNTEYYATYTAAAYCKIASLSKEYGMSIKPLAWAFLFPSERCFEGTRAFSTMGINKAIFNLFALFGKIGQEELCFSSSGALSPEDAEPYAKDRNNIATFDGDERRTDISGFGARGKNGEIQIFIYSHHDDRDIDSSNHIHLTVSGAGDSGSFSLTHYRIDKDHSNPYGEWVRQGKPWYPDEKQYKDIKSRDSLECLENKLINVKDGVLVHDFEMPTHSISFLVFEKAGEEK